MRANQILREKTIPEMTKIELQIVTNTAKDALFSMESRTTGLDLRKRAMGLWALEIFKDNNIDIITRTKIKNKYKFEISYYLRNKEMPKPTERQQEITNLLNDIEYELICREINLILANN